MSETNAFRVGYDRQYGGYQYWLYHDKPPAIAHFRYYKSNSDEWDEREHKDYLRFAFSGRLAYTVERVTVRYGFPPTDDFDEQQP